jgi:hypothetical protein
MRLAVRLQYYTHLQLRPLVRLRPLGAILSLWRQAQPQAKHRR